MFDFDLMTFLFWKAISRIWQNVTKLCCLQPLISSLQVKKTTQLWFGSGSTRARPSAARPVAPTTNWCPTSSPTNSSCLLLQLNITWLCICTMLASLWNIPLTFRTRWRNIRQQSFLPLSSWKFIYLGPFWFSLLPGLKLWALVWLVFDLFCYRTWSTCWPHQSLLFMLPFTEGSHVVWDKTLSL